MLAFRILFFIKCALAFSQCNEFDDNKQYSSSEIARCEHRTMRLGTEITDVFNAPIEGEDWNQRVHQDFIVQNLGFAPWMANGIHGSNGLTLSQRNAKELFHSAGWSGRSIEDSPYAILSKKWLYMFGDSTTRQVWASFAASFQGNNFERNAKEYSRHYCNKQSTRKSHPKGGFFPDEGWGGPCGVNEVTCHVSGFGEGGLLSFDWKHFPYEDYDHFMWSDQGPWIAGFGGEGERRPDVLTIQFGMHSCWHASPEGLYSKHLHEVNSSMINQHLEDIVSLFAAVRRAIDIAHSKSGKLTTVIVLTSGSTGMTNNATSIDNCILRFNRAASLAAHDYGFSVLDRGELERRLMYKSIEAAHPLLKPDMHLPQPAQNIIATCLLHLMHCLNSTQPIGIATPFINSTSHYPLSKYRKNSGRGTPTATALYSPPS
jgi:hypothetical protein